MRNTTRFSDPVFEKPEGSLHDWEIFTELGNRIAELRGGEAQPPMPPAEMIDMGLQMGPYKDQGLSLAKLRENPSIFGSAIMRRTWPERTAGLVSCPASARRNNASSGIELQRK